MNAYRVGIVGCGKIASDFADDPKMVGDVFTHAEAYSGNPATVFAAVCDTDPERLEKCGERWGVSARYPDLKAMIEVEDLDILSVCTPDETHYHVVKDILEVAHHVKFILCEKPLAMTVMEAEELVALSQEKGVILGVVYMRRYAQNYNTLKEYIQSGQLGEIQAVSGWYTKGVKHNGTHWFDALRFLVGDVQWVRAWQKNDEYVDDPTLDVVLGITGGGIASLRACDGRNFTIFDMEIMGTKGRIQLLDSGYKIELSQVVESKRYSGYKELTRTEKDFGDRKNLMLHAVEDVVAVLQTGKTPASSGQDGVEAVRIAACAIQSAQKGEVIQVQ